MFFLKKDGKIVSDIFLETVFKHQASDCSSYLIFDWMLVSLARYINTDSNSIVYFDKLLLTFFFRVWLQLSLLLLAFFLSWVLIMDLDTRPLHRLAFNFTQRPLEVLQQQKKKEIKDIC